MIWKIRWMKSSEMLGPTDMIGIIKNNFLGAISFITMKLYWMNMSSLDWPRKELRMFARKFGPFESRRLLS